jgi:hypothetical protein
MLSDKIILSADGIILSDNLLSNNTIFSDNNSSCFIFLKASHTVIIENEDKNASKSSPNAIHTCTV